MMLLYNWFRDQYKGTNPPIKKDYYRFTIANFSYFLLIDIRQESFASLNHIQQAFYLEDLPLPRWNIVTKIDIWSKRKEWCFVEEDHLFLVGSDLNFRCLYSNKSIQINDVWHIHP